MDLLLLLIPSVLFLGAAASGALALAGKQGRPPPRALVSSLSVGAPVAAFFAACRLFAGLEAHQSPVSVNLFRWFSAGALDVNFSLGADQLTCVMLLVITGVGSLIHIYSIGYMREDKGYARYFSFLNLFMGFMTILVMGQNLVVLFVGWEGVGLCSYLLIGFWWQDAKKAAAGMKAFLVNRVGDAAFLLGIFMLFNLTGTLNFHDLQLFFADPAKRALATQGGAFLGASAVTMVGLLLFIGATGKSAQIPLYVWLPDAMAGPTPVSALIHAATMVTAGVYMVARLNFLYALTPAVQGLIMVVAGATCLFAGVLALVQNDIKKVLAYSTISQIGYMFVGVASGFIGAGIFHLVTHAFFKACLFLGAGSIITMTHHQQDMRRMGGLARRMPWTCAVMAISAASMAGVPPLAGFFSKDEVLWRAFSAGSLTGRFAWFLGLLCAGLTGLYMFRLMFMTFSGKYRGEHLPREAPKIMLVPTQILALGAACLGFLAVPRLLGGKDLFGQFVAAIVPAYAAPAGALETSRETVLEWALLTWSVLIGVAGILAAWWCYVHRTETPKNVTERIPEAYALARQNFRVDERYQRSIVAPLERAARTTLDQKLEQGLIDGSVNGLARLCRRISGWLSLAQGGLVRGYVALMVVGTLLVLLLTMLT